VRSIIIFGDSIACGRNAKQNKGWAAKLSEKFAPLGGHNILYNLAICGDTSSNLVKRIKLELELRSKHFWPTDYHIVIIAIGINDSRINIKNDKPETTQKQFLTNVNSCVSYAKKYGDKIIIIGITPVDDKKTNPYEKYNYTNSKIKEYNAILKKVATKHKVLFIDIHPNLMKDGYIKQLKDGLHPDSIGHELILKNINKFILKKY